MEPYIFNLTPEVLGTGAYIISGICGVILVTVFGLIAFEVRRDRLQKQRVFSKSLDENVAATLEAVEEIVEEVTPPPHADLDHRIVRFVRRDQPASVRQVCAAFEGEHGRALVRQRLRVLLTNGRLSFDRLMKVRTGS